MKELDDYLSAKDSVYEYFGYVEGCSVLPIEDSRGDFWYISKNEYGRGYVRFSESLESLESLSEGCYESDIWIGADVDKHEYVGEEFTMVMVDTHFHGNGFLQIFENKLRIDLQGL